MNSANPGSPYAGSGTPYRWRVLWATFLTYFVDSYDLIVLAIAMPVLLKVLQISLPEGGLLASATMIGAVGGSVVFGLIAENRGRRFALVLALTWLGIGMGFVYFIYSWGQWMILRFLTGIGIGGIWGPCAALIASHWAPAYRGRAASFMLSSFAVGAIFVAFIGRLVLNIDWRILFLAGSGIRPTRSLRRLAKPEQRLESGPSLYLHWPKPQSFRLS
ncbi:MAG: MFS transporter [Deltaproteobacteria bacterium]|nr:MFS transporter [Deltaproteobacteria bacterium]